MSLKRLLLADAAGDRSRESDSREGLVYVSMLVEALNATDRPSSEVLGPAPCGLPGRNLKVGSHPGLLRLRAL